MKSGIFVFLSSGVPKFTMCHFLVSLGPFGYIVMAQEKKRGYGGG